MLQQNLSECKELLLQTPTFPTRVYIHQEGTPHLKTLKNIYKIFVIIYLCVSVVFLKETGGSCLL